MQEAQGTMNFCFSDDFGLHTHVHAMGIVGRLLHLYSFCFEKLSLRRGAPAMDPFLYHPCTIPRHETHILGMGVKEEHCRGSVGC